MYASFLVPKRKRIDPLNCENLPSPFFLFIKISYAVTCKTTRMKLKMHLQIVRSKMADGTGQVSSPLVRNLPLPHQEEDIYEEEIQWKWATTANDWSPLFRMWEEVVTVVECWNNCLFLMCINGKPARFGKLMFFPIYLLLGRKWILWFWRKLRLESLIV